MPAPLFNRASNRFEWPLPIRADVGSVVAAVERSANFAPSYWASSGVRVVGNTYSIPIVGKSGFMRLAA
jgi:hypothetical protein